MSVSINLRDITALGKEVEKVVGERIIAAAKKEGLKAELKGGSILISGDDAKTKKFVDNLQKLF